MIALRQFVALVGKDLLVEWRTRDLLATMMVLGLASIVLFQFAVDFGRIPFRDLGAPVLWLAFVFTGVTGLQRSFAIERANGCLDGLLLAPLDRGVLYLGKLAVNVLVLVVLELFLLGLALALLNHGPGRVELEAARWLLLLGVIGVNTVGFAAVGTLFALMAERTRRGDVLLPVLQGILSLPVLIAAVQATGRLLQPAAVPADIAAPLRLSIAFAVVFIALSLVVFDAVVED